MSPCRRINHPLASYSNVLESAAEYDEVADKWRIARVAHAGNNIRGKISLTTDAGPSSKSAGKKGHSKKGRKTAKVDPNGDECWTPLCVFGEDSVESGHMGASVFLTYDLDPRTIQPKKKAPTVKKLASSSNLSGGSARPGSAAGSRRALSSATRGTSAAKKAQKSEVPKERGLVGKTRRYA